MNNVICEIIELYAKCLSIFVSFYASPALLEALDYTNQNFAARILTGVKKYDHVSPALKELGWLAIERLLQLRDVTMVFKCVNNLAPIYLCNKLSKRSEIHKYSTRHCGDLNLGLCRTEAAKRSFFYRAVKHFNYLTSDTRSVNSVSIFKSLARRELLGK